MLGGHVYVRKAGCSNGLVIVSIVYCILLRGSRFARPVKWGQRFTATKYGILVFLESGAYFLAGVFVHSADVGISGAVIKLTISTYRFSVAQFYWKIVAVSHGQVFSVGAGFVWLNYVLEFRGVITSHELLYAAVATFWGSRLPMLV